MMMDTEPNTATFATLPPAETHQHDLRQARNAVRNALSAMRHDMDVSDEDGAPDRQGWIELERVAISILLRAYYRNHNVAVPA